MLDHTTGNLCARKLHQIHDDLDLLLLVGLGEPVVGERRVHAGGALWRQLARTPRSGAHTRGRPSGPSAGIATSINPTYRTSAPCSRNRFATANASTPPSDQLYSTYGPSAWDRAQRLHILPVRLLDRALDALDRYIGASAGSRLSSGSYTTVEPGRVEDEHGCGWTPRAAPDLPQHALHRAAALRCSRTTSASCSMVPASCTSSTAISPSARSDSRAANFRRPPPRVSAACRRCPSRIRRSPHPGRERQPLRGVTWRTSDPAASVATAGRPPTARPPPPASARRRLGGGVRHHRCGRHVGGADGIGEVSLGRLYQPRPGPPRPPPRHRCSQCPARPIRRRSRPLRGPALRGPRPAACWSPIFCTSSRFSTAQRRYLADLHEVRSRTACNCICGMSNSYSTRFLTDCHQRSCPFHQRDLGRQILGCSPSIGDDECQPILQVTRRRWGPTCRRTSRRPPASPPPARRTARSARVPMRQCPSPHRPYAGLHDAALDDGLEQQPERGALARVHLHRRATRMRGERGGQRAGGGQRAVADRRPRRRIVEDLRRGRCDQRVEVGDGVRLHLPRVPAVRHRDVRPRHPGVARRRQPPAHPVRLTNERGTRMSA